MKTALVTGAAGFCAGHLSKRLASEGGMRIVGTDCREPLGGSGVYDDFDLLDFGDSAEVDRLLRRVGPTHIFHLAGLQVGDAKDVYRTNVLGTVHLLEAVRRESRSVRVLLVGSAAEYGLVGKEELPVTETTPCRPHGPYGLSKHASTQAGLCWSRRFGMKVVVARPFNIVGAGIPPSLVVGALAARARDALSRAGEPVIKTGNLESARDFVSVEDTVDAYVRMMEGEWWGEIFNICSGESHPVREVAEALLSFAPRPIRIELDPVLVRPDEVTAIFGSFAKAHAAFGFVPRTPLREALRGCWNASAARGTA